MDDGNLTAHRPLPVEFSPRTIMEVLARRAEMHGERPAVIGAGPDGDIVLCYGELRALSLQMASLLVTEFGLSPGERVGWLLDNRSGLAAIVTFHAVLAAGGVNVPLNTRLHPAEVNGFASHSECRALVIDEEVAASIGDRLPLRPDQRLVIPRHWSRFVERITHAAVTLPRIYAEDLASILYTSGTTGTPKGVEHTHMSSLAAGISWSDAFRLGPNDRLQSPFPVFGGAGLHFNWLSVLWTGAALVIDGTSTLESVARIARHRSTVYVAVPSIYQFWLRDNAIETADVSSLRILTFGGAAMPAATINAIAEALPGVGLMQTYGLTEGGPGGTYLSEEYALAKIGSLGNRPAGRFTEFRVIDGDGANVAAGDIGEFVMRGPSVMRGYHRDPEATRQAMADGWLHSGDQVRFDSDGFLYFVDRKKDIIVRGGYNISSFEVEQVLIGHRAVREAAVFGVKHPQLGEDVVAAAVLMDHAAVSADDLLRHCRDSLADFKAPRRIHIVDELPYNAAGKVLKRQLSEQFEIPS